MPELDALWPALAAGLDPILRDRGARARRKADGTLVTDADLAAQALIERTLAAFDPGTPVVGEEGAAAEARGGRFWVVDPIDGTSQFADPAGREFCSAVALVEDGRAAACLILAPALGVMITARPGSPILVNGAPARPAPRTGLISATRSSKLPPAPLEAEARRRGLEPKVRATSQTLDMARTIIDLEPATGLASFRAFVAIRQWVWDAAPGLALARAAGRPVRDRAGRPLEPLDAATRRLPATLLADDEDAGWLAGAL